MHGVFIHIPKSAGMSIRSWITTNVNTSEDKKIYCYGHVTYQQVKENNPEVDWSFTIVRNSYERLVSLYLYTQRKSLRRMEKAIKRGEKDEGNEFVYNKTQLGLIPFLDFFLQNKTDNNFLMLLRTNQVEYAKGVDYILRHENLNEDFKIVQEKVNCYIPLTQDRNFMGIDKTPFYTNEYFKFVEKHFEEELEQFKYTRPL